MLCPYSKLFGRIGSLLLLLMFLLHTLLEIQAGRRRIMEIQAMLIQENVPLAPLTTFQIGGPARYFVEATTADEVKEAVAFSRARALPLFILGGGSNLVISDKGWPGLVIKLGILGINHVHSHGRVIFEAGAGEEWDGFVA